jgi:hypothetical protein
LRESGLRKRVAATLSVSIRQVRQGGAVAADYLFLAACVDRKDISLGLLEAASPRTREDAVKVLDRYALITDDLLSQHSMFIDLSTMRYERGWRRREESKNVFKAQSHSYSECSRTTVTVTEASGGHYCRTCGMFCRIPRGMMMRADWLLHESVPWLYTVMVNIMEPKSWRWK